MGNSCSKKSHSRSSHFITPSVRLPARNDTRCKNEIFRAGRMKCNAHRADVWNCQVYALFPDACASAQVLPPVLLNVCLNELLIFNKIQTKSEHKRPIKGNISTYKTLRWKHDAPQMTHKLQARLAYIIYVIGKETSFTVHRLVMFPIIPTKHRFYSLIIYQNRKDSVS